MEKGIGNGIVDVNTLIVKGVNFFFQYGLVSGCALVRGLNGAYIPQCCDLALDSVWFY